MQTPQNPQTNYSYSLFTQLPFIVYTQSTNVKVNLKEQDLKSHFSIKCIFFNNSHIHIYSIYNIDLGS